MNALVRTPLSLADMLEVENDSAILELRCPDTGIPLWVLLRIPFLRSIMSDALYSVPMVVPASGIPKVAAMLALGRAIPHNRTVLRRPRAEVLIAATGVGTILRDGLWFNRLSDHFASANPGQTLAIEDLFAWRWPFPRVNRRVLISAPTLAAAAIVGTARCGPSHRERAARMIAVVGQRARNLLGWDISSGRAAALSEWLARKSAALPWLYRNYRALLQRVGPRLVIKEEACYGPSAAFILAARDLGIATAEYQHGAISAGHDAYNVAETVRSDKRFRRTLPDYLLCYGRWWLEQINMPVQCVAIGNPHRGQQMLALERAQAGERRDILVLGDGIETRLYLGLARRLAEHCGERFPIVFRPHPLERAAVLSEFPSGWSEGIRIDAAADIYQSFRSSHAVVSDVSTGLFEAVGITDRVLVWNTAKARFAFPAHPFPSFNDEADLARQLLGAAVAPLAPATVNAIWEPDWRANYVSFLAGVGCTIYEGTSA